MRKDAVAIVLSVLLLIISGCASVRSDKPFTVGIAWRDDTKSDAYNRLVSYFEMAGCRVLLLDKTVSSDLEYYESGMLSDDCLNLDFSLTDEAASILWHTESISVSEMINEINLIVFSGGEDISPGLYREGYEPDFSYMYNPERDASDFLLMRYAIDNDIPVLGICRGMQMLAVVSGEKLIDDIPSYYPDLRGIHRTEDGKYSFHSVEITDRNSVLYSLNGKKSILDEAASSHHQSVLFENNGSIIATAFRGPIIEAIERTDKSFIIGVQFHPEYYSVHQDMHGASDSVKFIRRIIGDLRNAR